MNQEKRIRLEVMRPTLQDTTNKIKNTHTDHSMRLEKKPKYPSEEKKQIKKSITTFKNLVNRLNGQEFHHYELIAKGDVEVINKKSGLIEFSMSGKNEKEMIQKCQNLNFSKKIAQKLDYKIFKIVITIFSCLFRNLFFIFS